MPEQTEFTLESQDENGKEITVTIAGETDMPFWEHDLKLKAIKMLLNTVDRKHFYEDDKHMEFETEMDEIQSILKSVREF